MIVDREDFNPLVGKKHYTCMLPAEQMKKIYEITAINDSIIIGIQWREDLQQIKLLLGNFATISVPKSMFPSYLPLEHPRISDYGFQTSFGDYKVNIKEILQI